MIPGVDFTETGFCRVIDIQYLQTCNCGNLKLETTQYTLHIFGNMCICVI